MLGMFLSLGGERLIRQRERELNWMWGGEGGWWWWWDGVTREVYIYRELMRKKEA